MAAGKIHFLVLMGVSGSGKTTVGKLLAKKLGWAFFDGNNYHPPEYVSRMRGGAPLKDSDRAPWLETLHDLIAACLEAGQPGILAASVLMERFRERLLTGNHGVQVVFLKGDHDLILSRMSSRKGNSLKPDMLQEQFDILEEPQDAWVVDISSPVEEITEEIIDRLRQAG